MPMTQVDFCNLSKSRLDVPNRTLDKESILKSHFIKKRNKLILFSRCLVFVGLPSRHFAISRQKKPKNLQKNMSNVILKPKTYVDVADFKQFLRNSCSNCSMMVLAHPTSFIVNAIPSQHGQRPSVAVK